MNILPRPPHIKLSVSKREIFPESGFLQVERCETTFHYPDGKISEPFPVFAAVRKGFDAVVIAAYYIHEEKELMVYLRSAIRPALVFRDYSNTSVPELESVGNHWELPAGFVELDELKKENGYIEAAIRETREELGFECTKMAPLGPHIYSCAGLSAERLFFFETEVVPHTRKEPTLDGGPFEYGGQVKAIPITEALTLLNRGWLRDAKTEIGLMRLANRYNYL